MLVFVGPLLAPPHTGQDEYHSVEADPELCGHPEDRISELHIIEKVTGQNS